MKIEDIIKDLYNNPIGKAVEPLRIDAINKAEQKSLEIIENIKKLLSDNNNNLDIIAPYPKSNIGKNEYLQALQKRKNIQMVTKPRFSVRNMSDPNIVDICQNKIEDFINTNKELAAQQYDSFVKKLISKIGDVKEANLIGNHVWAESFLTVTKLDDTKEVWKTQQIVNISKLGTLFNQWPTRKIK